MSPISFDMSTQGWTDASSELLMGPQSLSEQLLGGGNPTASQQRHNLRSRSNSMPVSFSSMLNCTRTASLCACRALDSFTYCLFALFLVPPVP